MIARHGAEPVRAVEIADRLGLPANYLSKILHALARNGVLVSGRGPTGGFRLARSAKQVTIEEIIAEFEDIGETRQCLLRRGRCTDESSCPMHAHWKEVSAPVFAFFRSTSLADLLEAGDGPAGRGRRARAASRTTRLRPAGGARRRTRTGRRPRPDRK
jgi:Rrf2 family protein